MVSGELMKAKVADSRAQRVDPEGHHSAIPVRMTRGRGTIRPNTRRLLEARQLYAVM
jgi:hypothetical protein